LDAKSKVMPDRRARAAPPHFDIPPLAITKSSKYDPARSKDLSPHVEVFRNALGEEVFRCWAEGAELWIDVPRISQFCMAVPGSHISALPCPGARPDVIKDAYRRIALPMILQAKGLEVLHGSAVRVPSGVVAFCADAGTGKSTTAFALTRRGYPLWADDAVAVQIAEDPIQSIFLPTQIRLRSESLAFYESGTPSARLTPSSVAFGDGEMARLCAVLILKRGAPINGETRAFRLDPVTAVTSLLEHAFCFEFQKTESKRRMSENYLALSSRIPVISLRYESGLKKLDTVLDMIEQEIHDLPAIG
jgi:hypothetical protein